MPSITLADARKAIDAALKKAEEFGAHMAIVVVDDHADLVASVKMDGCPFPFAPDVTRGKAMATVLWRGQPSSALVERANAPVMAMVRELYNHKVVYAAGAVPIKRNGVVIGAIAGGGGTSEQDEQVALAGAAAIGG